MDLLVFGVTGQVARALQDTVPAGYQPRFVDRETCDLSVSGAARQLLAETRPALIINAAAFTAVDKAESEVELAEAINCHAVAEMAEYAAEHGARLIHLSTDFVFDGQGKVPYRPGDRTMPLGAYGKSKLDGELAALQAAPESTLIIRTAWVYSEYGQNFVKTMLRLIAERDQLGVVADQRGSPTYAGSLADVIWQIVEQPAFAPGIYHWTDQGDITWHQFALAIQEEAIAVGLLAGSIPVNAITTEDYPTPAERPAYSVLDTRKLATHLGIEPTPWRDNLRLMLTRLP